MAGYGKVLCSSDVRLATHFARVLSIAAGHPHCFGISNIEHIELKGFQWCRGLSSMLLGSTA